ncbi:MAG: glycosyltransferase [Spartobacteria bacterium]|nr:glycosyltransferase [Spartobacteria bacterium]
MNSPPPPPWPAISVIIVTKQRHELAQKAVASVLQTDYPPVLREIVVVEETDTPRPIEGDGVAYHTIPLEHRGIGYIRNVAIGHATHALIVFTDDDCLVASTWLTELIRPFLDHPDTGAVAGAVKVPPCGPVGQCENILGFPGGGMKYVHRARGRVIPLPTFSTCNGAINRRVTGPVSFESGCRMGGEDELLSRRISSAHPVLYTPDAVVYHQPRDNIRRVFQWFVRRGLARIEILPHVEHARRTIRHLLWISPAFRLLLITGLAALLRLPIFPVWALCFLAYYTAVLFKYRWSRAYYPSMQTFLLIPLVKLVMDIALDYGSIKAWLHWS